MIAVSHRTSSDAMDNPPADIRFPTMRGMFLFERGG
jgi:hypothetical protein